MGKGAIRSRRWAGLSVGFACLTMLLLVACSAGQDAGPGRSTAADESTGPGGSASDATPTPVASEDSTAATSGRVELNGTVHEFADAIFCEIDASDEIPVRVTFGDEVFQDPNVDALVIGRAGSSDTRILVELGTDRWDGRFSDPPQIAGGTATWEGITLGRVDGTGQDTMTITVSCG